MPCSEYLEPPVLASAFDLRMASTRRLLAAEEGTPPRHIEVGQSAGHEGRFGILIEAATAGLGEAELSFDASDGVLDLGPAARPGAILPPIELADDGVIAAVAIGEILGVRRLGLDDRSLADSGLIAPIPGFRAMQQIR